MSKTFQVNFMAYTQVEADDADEAGDIVNDAIRKGHFNDDQTSITNVEIDFTGPITEVKHA